LLSISAFDPPDRAAPVKKLTPVMFFHDAARLALPCMDARIRLT